MLLQRVTRDCSLKGGLAPPALAMEEGRNPNSQHTPSAARALALIWEAVQVAESRSQVSPGPTPSPTPSPRPLPRAQPAYPQPYHAYEAQSYPLQEGPMRQEGWGRAQPGLIPSPRDGPGALLEGQYAYPPPQKPQVAPRYNSWEGDAQPVPSISASLGSGRSLSSGDLRGPQHPYPQQSQTPDSRGTEPPGRPREAPPAALPRPSPSPSPSPSTGSFPALQQRALQRHAFEFEDSAEAGGTSHGRVGFQHQQMGAATTTAVSQELSAFPRLPPSHEPLSHRQQHHAYSAPGYGPHGGWNAAGAGAGQGPPLGSIHAPGADPGADRSTRPWNPQVTQQHSAVPFPAFGPGISQQGAPAERGIPPLGAPREKGIPFSQAPGYPPPTNPPGIHHNPRAQAPHSTHSHVSGGSGSHHATGPYPPEYSHPHTVGAQHTHGIPHPATVPHPHSYMAGAQHPQGIPHPAANAPIAASDERRVAGPAHPDTWHSAPIAGWHYAPRAAAPGQIGETQTSRTRTVPAPPQDWSTAGAPARGSVPQGTGAEAGQDRQALAVVGIGAGAAVGGDAHGGLAPHAQPLPAGPSLPFSMDQGPVFHATQGPTPLSAPTGGAPYTAQQGSVAEGSREEFSLDQLSGMDWVAPGLQAWESGEPDLGEAYLGELDGELNAGLWGEGGQERGEVLRELETKLGEAMDGEWMDGTALQGLHTSPAAAAAPAQQPALQAPAAQEGVAQAPTEQSAAAGGGDALATHLQALDPPAEQAGLSGTGDAPRAGEQQLGQLVGESGAPGKSQLDSLDGAATRVEAAGKAIAGTERASMQRQSESASVQQQSERESVQRQGANASMQPQRDSANVQQQNESASMQPKAESGDATREVMPKVNVRMQTRTRVSLPPDGHFWTKYGEKTILSNSITRSYFKCSLSKSHTCNAKKVVDFSISTPLTVTPRIQYSGTHSHPPPPQDSRLRSAATENPWGGSQIYHVTSVPTIAATRPREGAQDQHQVPLGSAQVPGATRPLGRAADLPRQLQTSRSAQGPGHRGALSTTSGGEGNNMAAASEEAKSGLHGLTQTRSLSE